MSESQSIESATTLLSAQPDNKTRRYDRQLRLWAASGQSALERSRILVLGADATSTSILKNLVLPGIGHFTLVDDKIVTGADAGNNFFLDGWDSVGKNRASEAVSLLRELNDGVEGDADTRSIKAAIGDKEWLKTFTIVIAHNLDKNLLDELAATLWEDIMSPHLIVIRSAGFLAEFYIQFHDHTIIESHTDTAPTLRLSLPFPSLLSAALSTPFSTLDRTDHGHVPYPLILIHALHAWRSTHNDRPPSTYREQQGFKETISRMKKADEENFEEASAQAYRVWTSSKLPEEIVDLFEMLTEQNKPQSPANAGFYVLLTALKRFTELKEYEGLLPLTTTLPDMKSDTQQYIALQRLYREQADMEKAVFTTQLGNVLKEQGADLHASPPPFGLDQAAIDTFIKNAHGLRVLAGEKWGSIDDNPNRLATALQMTPKETATHLALSALFVLRARGETISQETLWEDAAKLVGDAAPLDEVEDVEVTIGEIARAPSAELPNMAAFIGGMVAQETIKMVTRQYVPVRGYCVIDLVDASTGVIEI